MKNYLKNLSLSNKKACYLFLLILCIGCADSPDVYSQPDPSPAPAKSIKIGLLLDTSNSMDGLIEQAKSQLWKIVNELAMAKCEGQVPKVTIALYEYGNDRLSASEGYIRLVTPLTTDLDQLSEDLFGLTTNGGSEFCGHVIQSATNQLDWGAGDEDLKILFIAGNEPFSQGSVNYTEACAKANRMGITINTIFCGNFNEGIQTSWKNGADISNGYYMSIEQNRKTVYIASPYDDEISKLNGKLNDTYVYYGREGKSKKQQQIMQDNNAAGYGKQNMVQRAVSKSSHVYKNTKWDLVDAAKEESFDFSEVEEESLPEVMIEMNDQERKDYIDSKNAERELIKSKINELNTQRNKYIAEKKKNSAASEKSLDNAMVGAIREQAKLKNFTFE